MKKSQPQHPPSSRSRPRRPKLTRREALQAAGLGIAGLGAGCLGPKVSRCESGPVDPPLGTQELLSSFDHLVVVMMENRSFDHLFGGLTFDPDYPAAARLIGLDRDAGNPDPNGIMVRPTLLPGNGSLNPLHSWDDSHVAFNGGRNDGFVKLNAGSKEAEVMSYLDRGHLPFTYALVGESTICDRWFSSVMGPTWPNRFYLHATTSLGRRGNEPMGLSGPSTIWERMADGCWSAKNYFAGAIPWYSVAFPFKSFSGNDAMVPEPMDAFFRDAASGELPNFALIDPDFELNDGHPPHDLALADAFVSSVHRALLAGPRWSRTLLVVTYDEHGGFWDHVAPPPTIDPEGAFLQLGFRVPAIVAGPMVRRGAVVSAQLEHCSIAATLGARFGIKSLGARMDATADLSSCIDPALAGRLSSYAAPLPSVRLRSALAQPGALRASSLPELHRLARGGGVPLKHVDRRDPADRVKSWLRHAQELEAVKVIA